MSRAFIGSVLKVILRTGSSSLSRSGRGLLIGMNRFASAAAEKGSAAEPLRSVVASFATTTD